MRFEDASLVRRLLSLALLGSGAVASEALVLIGWGVHPSALQLTLLGAPTALLVALLEFQSDFGARHME